MVDALKSLPPEKLNIVHQTGELDFEKVEKGYSDANWQADIRQYISDMMSEFAKADLVICRAGATTCAELAAAGKAAIMIPLPTAADDHQRKNAEALQTAGAAKMILQADLTGESLANEIESLINAPEKITEMESRAKSLAKADAAEKAANIIEQLTVNR
jgi:UDP-N-acetylglucosamine--N-acetylmuramyl-(pentapeptide) pyrophosphoryl-undecaprenol N-acetylglucosamine transferase